MASGIEIPFTGGEYYALKDVPHGDVQQLAFMSRQNLAKFAKKLCEPIGRNEILVQDVGPQATAVAVKT